MSNKIYDSYMAGLREKFNLPYGKIELETEHKGQVLSDDNRPSKFATERVQYLKDKFGLPDGLIVKGLASRDVETLEDRSTNHAADSMKGMKLATASTSYKGKPVRLWYSITK